jgi:hypothetical protein
MVSKAEIMSGSHPMSKVRPRFEARNIGQTHSELDQDIEALTVDAVIISTRPGTSSRYSSNHSRVRLKHLSEK